MDIVINPAIIENRAKPPDSDLGFGTYFTDHMFMMDFNRDMEWHNARVEPYGPLSLDPAAQVLHYNQEVFEGTKAYLQANGGIALFRPEKNIERMNTSAARLAMPTLEPRDYLEAIKALVLIDKDWVPVSNGTSLYIRPTIIATEASLLVRPSDNYLFYIILSPVGSYYTEGLNPTKIYATDEYARATPGGAGATKTSGNYAPTLLAASSAMRRGYTQVLWLDSKERKYIEEVGTSNIFFLINDELVTPPLGGTILPGVTRDSIIQLAKHWGLKIVERRITIDEVTAAVGDRSLQEVFASGTAAVISPVGTIGYRDKDYTVADGQIGVLSQKFYDEITGIQYGRIEDPFGWRIEIA